MTLKYFYQNKIPCMWVFRSNESLINRARNKMAHDFLKSPCTHLLFIDADLGWTDTDVNNLITSDQLIVGGTYPTKMLPVNINLNALPDQAQEFFPAGYKSVEAFDAWVAAKADAKGLIQVLHVPTGFLLIDRQAFERLAPHVAEYDSLELSTGEHETIKEYFPVRVKDRLLESEDWAFCSIAREHGIPIYLQSQIICSHMGTYEFKV